MSLRHPSDVYYELFRDWIPSVHRHGEEIGRETVQVVVWLVGLSSALLGLVATNHVPLSGLSPIGRSVTALLFVGVAILGVVQRMVYHVYDTKQKTQFHRLSGHLAGLNSKVDPLLPLKDSWDRVEIIKQLRLNFNLECEFLDRNEVPIDKCREFYSNNYDNEVSSEFAKLNDFGETLAAYFGQPKGKGREFLGLDTDAGTYREETRVRGVSLKRWSQVSYLLFYLCCTCFVLGLAMVEASMVG